FNRLQTTRTLLADSKDKPSGDLRVTAPVGLGSTWLTPRLPNFQQLYPDITVDLILTDVQIDIAMREADCGIWLSEPSQKELIRRPLFTVHLHAYASPSYIKEMGSPNTIDELNGHRLITFGGAPHLPSSEMNWVANSTRERGIDAKTVLKVDNIYGLLEAARAGIGIAVLPDYIVNDDNQFVVVMENTDLPELSSYFVFSEELRGSKRLTVFRDFVVAQARLWKF
ncbi:MAG: substrate binding domain-containing protein, partial [Pseudomonadota bacterium]